MRVAEFGFLLVFLMLLLLLGILGTPPLILLICGFVLWLPQHRWCWLTLPGRPLEVTHVYDLVVYRSETGDEIQEPRYLHDVDMSGYDAFVGEMIYFNWEENLALFEIVNSPLRGEEDPEKKFYVGIEIIGW